MDPSGLCDLTSPGNPGLAFLAQGRAPELGRGAAHTLALGSCREAVSSVGPAIIPVCPARLQPKLIPSVYSPAIAGKVVLPLPLPPKASRSPKSGHTGLKTVPLGSSGVPRSLATSGTVGRKTSAEVASALSLLNILDRAQKLAPAPLGRAPQSRVPPHPSPCSLSSPGPQRPLQRLSCGRVVGCGQG